MLSCNRIACARTFANSRCILIGASIPGNIMVTAILDIEKYEIQEEERKKGKVSMDFASSSLIGTGQCNV